MWNNRFSLIKTTQLFVCSECKVNISTPTSPPPQKKKRKKEKGQKKMKNINPHKFDYRLYFLYFMQLDLIKIILPDRDQTSVQSYYCSLRIIIMII